MLRIQFWLGLVCSILALVCIGCGSGSTHPPTIKVSGKVTLDGAALAGAVVTFSPDGQGGHAASGTTDASGTYQLTSFESGDGAVAGSYKVAVTKTVGSSDPAAGITDMDAAYKAADKAKSGGGGASQEKEAVPNKYTNSITSGLTATVKAEGPMTLDFPLTSK